MNNVEQSLKCVFISCFNAYDNRIVHIEKILANNGYNCFYITSNFNHGVKEHYNIDRDNAIQIATLPYSRNFSIKRLLSHLIFSYKAIKQIKSIKPDILYVMLPPNSLAYFASNYKKKHSTKLIFDIYDLWPETFPSKKYKALLAAPFRIWRNLRNNNLKYADVVVTECDLFGKKIRDYIGDIETFTLYPVKVSDVIKKEIDISKKRELNICYLGSINNIIDTDNICELLGKVNLLKPVVLHIIGDGEKRKEFITLLEEKNIDIKFYGCIYDETKKQDIFDRCVLGINMMKATVCVGLTLKSIEYLHAGLPLLNNIKGDSYEMIAEYGIGFNVDGNVDSTVQSIVNLSQEEIHEMKCQTKVVYGKLFSLEVFSQTIESIFSLK